MAKKLLTKKELHKKADIYLCDLFSKAKKKKHFFEVLSEINAIYFDKEIKEFLKEK